MKQEQIAGEWICTRDEMPEINELILAYAYDPCWSITGDIGYALSKCKTTENGPILNVGTWPDWMENLWLSRHIVWWMHLPEPPERGKAVGNWIDARDKRPETDEPVLAFPSLEHSEGLFEQRYTFARFKENGEVCLRLDIPKKWMNIKADGMDEEQIYRMRSLYWLRLPDPPIG